MLIDIARSFLVVDQAVPIASDPVADRTLTAQKTSARGPMLVASTTLDPNPRTSWRTRELRELVRHRAKLVGLRSHCKAEVHAVLAKCGVQVLMSDLFGVAGTALLDGLDLPAPYAARIASLRRLMDDLDFEVDLFAGMVRGRMAREPGYTAVQKIPGIGPTLGAVFVAEIGDITRFASAPKLTCWAGLTPKHHESDTHVHRGRITKQGSRLVRWAAIESVKTISATTPAGVLRERVADRRGRNIGSVAAARRQLEFVFYALRDGHVRALEHPPRVA
jgi:transposase